MKDLKNSGKNVIVQKKIKTLKFLLSIRDEKGAPTITRWSFNTFQISRVMRFSKLKQSVGMKLEVDIQSVFLVILVIFI